MWKVLDELPLREGIVVDGGTSFGDFVMRVAYSSGLQKREEGESGGGLDREWWCDPEFRRVAHVPLLVGAWVICALGVYLQWAVFHAFPGDGAYFAARVKNSTGVLLICVGSVGVVASIQLLRIVRRIHQAVRSESPCPMQFIVLRDPGNGAPYMLLFPASGGLEAQPSAALVLMGRDVELLPRLYGAVDVYFAEGKRDYALPVVDGRPRYSLSVSVPLDSSDPEWRDRLLKLVAV